MTGLELDFGILGPVEARTVSGSQLAVPRGRPLALLALLLVRRGGVVSTDTAIEVLWGKNLPVHPSNALQVVVSRVRQALRGQALRQQASREQGPASAELLVSQGTGYALRLAVGMLDADRFEALATAGRAQLARGDVAGAATALRHALALWRGPALADFRDEPFAAAEVGRLDELRLAALGDRIDADLALGRHPELVGELAGLVEAHPLREPLRGQLMLALYGSGRQAEALATYREARRVLVDELGIEPSGPLREIERLVLQGAPLPHSRPAEPMPTGATSTGARRRQVTCLVVEPAGNELTARLDPEALQRFLLDLQDLVRGVCDRLDGTARETSAGEITTVFGWPRAHEDDALRAVLTAAELRGAPAGSRLRFGVATGEVVTPGPGVPLVLGDAAAWAHRLARSARPGQVLLASSTWALVRDSADGTISRDSAVVLGSVHADAVAIRRRRGGPLIGRGTELNLLLEAYERATATRTCQLVTVLGEPGVGKTRLSRELARRLGGRATVLRGACPLYDRPLTYWPLREIVRAGAGEGDVTEWVVDLGLDRAVAERIAATFGLTDVAAAEETRWAFRRLVAALAERGPVVLVIDDIHAARPELLEVLDQLADLPDASVLLVCLARPELLETFATWGSGRTTATTVALRPLNEASSRDLVLRLTATSDQDSSAIHDATMVERVVRTAGGNPLFLEQLFRHLAERPDQVGEIPPGLQALLTARLDLIPATERDALERGAVEGETFHLEPVLAMGPDPDASPGVRRQVQRALESLIRRDLVAPTFADLAGAGPAFAFRHRLVRDAAYAALKRADRAVLHERYADWLGRLDLPRLHTESRRGFHLEQAHDHLEAVGGDRAQVETLALRAGGNLAEAAGHAHRHSDLAAEIGLLERALRLLGTDRAEGAELLSALAAAHIEAGTFARAAEVAAIGRRVGVDLDLPSVYWSATVERERLRLYSQPDDVDVEASLLIAEQAAARLTELGNDLGLARVDYLAAELMWMRGEPDTAVSHLRRQVTHARRAGAGFEMAAGLTYLAWSLVEGATPVAQALEGIAELEATAAGDHVAGLGLLGFRAVLEAMAGRPVDAREHIARSRAGFEELGFRLPAAAMADFDARTLMLEGEYRAAEQAVHQALHISRESGDRWFQSTLLVDLAHAVLGAGARTEAETAVARIETVPAPSDTEWVVRRATALARLASLQGDPEAAVARAREAVSRADPTQMLTLRTHAHCVLVEVLMRGGRQGDAATAAAAARALVDRKGDRASAAILRHLVGTPG